MIVTLLKDYFLVAIWKFSATRLHTDNPEFCPDRWWSHCSATLGRALLQCLCEALKQNKEQGNHWHYLSIAGEGSVVKQEISTEEHHNSIINTQDGPVKKGGPRQQRILSNISGKGKQDEWDTVSLEWVHIYSLRAAKAEIHVMRYFTV